MHALLYLENRDLSKFDYVCGSVSRHKQWRSLRTSEKELEKVTKPSIKCLDITNPQSDTLRTNRGNSGPMLHSPRVRWPTKITLKARRVIVRKVAKEPRVIQGCPSSGGHWTTMVFMAELQGESHCSPKRTLLPICSLLKIFWTSHRTVEEMFCGRMRPKYNFLV